MYRIVFLYVFIFSVIVAKAQINIWEGTDVHKRVELTPYIADSSCSPRMAIVVCPGGSYFWHDTENEGRGVGRWLQKNGITAFVLNYRTAYVPAFITHYRLFFRGNRYPDPQNDLLRSIQYIKSHAEEFHVDKTKIGVMGFSAGGHLAMSAAELFDKENRPAFVAAIYPVVTMLEPYVHKRSCRGLLGDSRVGNKWLCDKLSLERHIPSDCPPVFLVNSVDDPIVDYHHSVLLDSALTEKHIDYCYVQFQTGGHGYGVSEKKGTAESRQWKSMFLEWIKTVNNTKTR